MRRLIPLVASAALFAAPTPATAQAIPPHPSWTVLPWTNGVASAAFDTVRRRVVSFREHVYARRDAATATRELAYDLYFGVRTGGVGLWLPSRPLDRAGWDGRAGIVEIEQHVGPLRVVQRWLSPFATDQPIIVAVVEVTNTGAAPLADAALYSLANLRLGDGDGTTGERLTWTGGAYEERGARGLAVHRPLPAPTHHGASPANPYDRVLAGQSLIDTDDSGVRDDAVAGFEWDLAGLAPGASRQFAVAYAYAANGDRAAADRAIAAAGASPEAILAAARADWDAFFARARTPDGLSADERAVYDRQLAVLRMAQIREPGRGHGAIVASLPPGMWNIAWVRDQAYATWALIDAGLLPEAEAAIEFWLGAQAGGFVCCDRDGGPWVGAPYAISVVRYFGDGTEESDFDQRGPNVEFDGFGLALGVLEDHLRAGGDPAIVARHAAAIFDRTADVLVGLREPGGPHAGLIRADSSIWESHWYDGGRQHWAFTQATSVLGLRAAAALAERAGRSADAARYRTAADELNAAAVAALIGPDQVVRASVEQTASYLDAAAVSFLRWGLVPADGAVAQASLAAWRRGLFLGLTGHGYHRNDDGGAYDEREWIAIDLWLADALRAAGDRAAADALVDWVTAQARLNFDLVPENLDRVTADYQGEVPMAGFGAGAYVTSLWRRGTVGPVLDAGTADGGLDGGSDGGGDPDGCCATGSPRDGGLALVVVAALLRRRRRPARRA